VLCEALAQRAPPERLICEVRISANGRFALDDRVVSALGDESSRDGPVHQSGIGLKLPDWQGR